MYLSNLLDCRGFEIDSTNSTEPEVKSSKEHGCFIPFFSPHSTSIPQTSQELIELRRLKVKTHINQLDFLLTQLYFLVFQHHRENFSIENCALPHIAIEGSYLDENVSSIINCLMQFIETLPEDKKACLSKVLVPLQASVPITGLICSLTDAPTEKMQSAIIEQLITLLNQQYQHLPVGSKMLIPAGYITGNRYDITRQGHAVIIEFHKIEGGKVDLRVFNTGEGLQYHEEINSMRFPFTIQNVEASHIDRDFFKNLCGLGYKKNDQDKPNTIDDLYYLLVWKFGFQEEYYNPRDAQYYDQGGVNSCAHQCFIAWIKTTLGKEHPDLFCDFVNYLARDRMSKIKAISDKEKSNLYIQKPYAVYSFTLQNSLSLTLLSVAKRVFQGPLILVKVGRSDIDKTTTYFEKHFEQNAGFQIKSTRKVETRDSAAKLKMVYKGKVLFDFQEMQTLRSSDLLDRLLNFLNYLYPLKNRLEKGAISPSEASQLLISLYNDQTFKRLPEHIKKIIAAGCISVSAASGLTELQKKNLENLSINQLIISGKLSVQDALELNEKEIQKLDYMQVFFAVESGSITWRRALSLNEHEIKILEHDIIPKLIKCKIMSSEEAFKLTTDQLEWFDNSVVNESMVLKVINWKKGNYSRLSLR